MKYAGKILLSTVMAGMMVGPSFYPSPQENNTVVFVPMTYDRIYDHRSVTDTPTVVDVPIPYGYPVDSSALSKSIHKSSGFGYRMHPIWKTRKLHTGLDMGAKTGTPIVTPGDGKVIRIQRRKTGYGWNVVIQHTDIKYRTLYAHMSRIDVTIGQEVKAGEQIGAVGNTGSSTAAHLHYEVMVQQVKKNGKAGKYKKVNPVPFIEESKQVSLAEVL